MVFRIFGWQLGMWATLAVLLDEISMLMVLYYRPVSLLASDDGGSAGEETVSGAGAGLLLGWWDRASGERSQ